MTLLAIDIGNTAVKLGLFEGLQLRESFRLSTIRRRSADEYVVFLKGLFDPGTVHAAIAASVVPPVTENIEEALQKVFQFSCIFVDPVETELMPLNVDYPAEVGVDRVVNAYCAMKLYAVPLIVIDFGTATTLDAVSTEGAYEGGAIAPGVEISAEALFEQTAMLPRIRLRKVSRKIGKNTREAMQIGLYEGLVGQVEAVVARFRRELGQEAQVIATGGLAKKIASDCKCIQKVEPDLSLKGLAMIYRDFFSEE